MERLQSTDQFLPIDYIPDWLQEYARERDENSPPYKNSQTDNSRRYISFIAERIFAEAHGIAVAGETETQYDLSIQGTNIDIKTTGRDAALKLHYEFNIPKRNFDYQQETDFYYFVNGNKASTKLVVVGWISKRDFAAVKKTYKKGEYKQTVRGKKIYWKEDYYSIEISKLYPFPEHFIEKIKEKLYVN